MQLKVRDNIQQRKNIYMNDVKHIIISDEHTEITIIENIHIHCKPGYFKKRSTICFLNKCGGRVTSISYLQILLYNVAPRTEKLF